MNTRIFRRSSSLLMLVTLLSSFTLLFSACQPDNIASSQSKVHLLYVVTASENGQNDRLLSAFDPATGKISWQRKLDTPLFGYGVSTQDNLYLPALDGNVYAFSDQDGRLLWHTSMSQSIVGFTTVWLGIYRNFVIDSVTNAKNDNGDLYALDAQTGNVVWHTTITCTASSSSDCAAGGRMMLLANGTLYGLAHDGISAWNAANGGFLWRNPHYLLNGQPQAMTAAQGKIYITNFYPEVDVLDAQTGRFLHSLRPAEPDNSGAVVYDITADTGTVYVLGGQTLTAYRAADDSLFWKQASSYHSGGTIEMGKNALYILYTDMTLGMSGKSSSYFYALRPQNGNQMWYLQFPGAANYQYPIQFSTSVCFTNLHTVYCVNDGKVVWQFSSSRYVEELFGS